ncbi:Ribosomal large subunit pseudouridine synthase B [hydrothermal vent metagenome]|uniref:Ribosomal large subunit pseudouridine synthase B n=1 Tax=hydrothermal vent metagenome TaxID=652676 RepID=A0A3B0VY34_9ZZZZ
MTSTSPNNEKLQKILARAGFGSRRSVEPLIAEGHVKVNGRVAKLGDRATANDRIMVKDRLIKESRLEKQSTKIILYNKPEGRICTRNDEKGRETIFEQLPRIFNGRWINIGRLDLNTSGLMILTNNGELANRMMHPSYEMEREYTVRVFGDVTDVTIKKMQAGVTLEDGVARFTRIQKMKQSDEGQNKWFRVTLKQGKYREVRRIWESQGHPVSRLHRVRYGLFTIPKNLRKGKTEELSWKQVNQLLKSVDLSEEARPDMRHQQGRIKTTERQSKAMNKQLNRKKKTIHDLSEEKGCFRRGGRR